jgi:hypothetical protein
VTTDTLGTDRRESSGGEGAQSPVHITAVPREDGYAQLVEAGQRTSTDAVHDDGIYHVLSEQEHGLHAPSLVMRWVLEDQNVGGFAIAQVRDREVRTTAEVAGA